MYASGGGLLRPPRQKEGTFNLNLEQFSSTKASSILESKDICKWSFTIWAPIDIVTSTAVVWKIKTGKSLTRASPCCCLQLWERCHGSNAISRVHRHPQQALPSLLQATDWWSKDPSHWQHNTTCSLWPPAPQWQPTLSSPRWHCYQRWRCAHSPGQIWNQFSDKSLHLSLFLSISCKMRTIIFDWFTYSVCESSWHNLLLILRSALSTMMLWSWQRSPGITALQTNAFPLCSSFWICSYLNNQTHAYISSICV